MRRLLCQQGAGNEALGTQAVQIERRLARAGFLHAHDPFGIGGKAESGRIVFLLWPEQRLRVLMPRPELPEPIIVSINLLVLLDGCSTIGRLARPIRSELVVDGWAGGTRRCGDDAASNKHADQEGFELHFEWLLCPCHRHFVVMP
jgi:hypothetical protein